MFTSTRMSGSNRDGARRGAGASLDLGVLLLSGGLIGAAAGCFWLLYNVFGTSDMDAPQAAVQTSVTDGYAAASLPDSFSPPRSCARTRPTCWRATAIRWS